jgi:hypothetical protein
MPRIPFANVTFPRQELLERYEVENRLKSFLANYRKKSGATDNSYAVTDTDRDIIKRRAAAYFAAVGRASGMGHLERHDREVLEVYYRVQFDMSWITWILTANSVNGLSEPFLRRCPPTELTSMTQEHLIGFAEREVARRDLPQMPSMRSRRSSWQSRPRITSASVRSYGCSMRWIRR